MVVSSSRLLKSSAWPLFTCRYGFLGKKFKDLSGHILGPMLNGLVGLKKPQDHGVTYSLTEEFVSVYRMHTLLPEKFILRDIMSSTSEDKCPPTLEEYFPSPLLSALASSKLLGSIRTNFFWPFFCQHFLVFHCCKAKVKSLFILLIVLHWENVTLLGARNRV